MVLKHFTVAVQKQLRGRMVWGIVWTDILYSYVVDNPPHCFRRDAVIELEEKGGGGLRLPRMGLADGSEMCWGDRDLMSDRERESPHRLGSLFTCISAAAGSSIQPKGKGWRQAPG